MTNTKMITPRYLVIFSLNLILASTSDIDSTIAPSIQLPDGCEKDGSFIPVGPYKNPSDACEMGTCMEVDGKFFYHQIAIDCQWGECVAPVYTDGQCCPTCSDSPATTSTEAPDVTELKQTFEIEVASGAAVTTDQWESLKTAFCTTLNKYLAFTGMKAVCTFDNANRSGPGKLVGAFTTPCDVIRPMKQNVVKVMGELFAADSSAVAGFSVSSGPFVISEPGKQCANELHTCATCVTASRSWQYAGCNPTDACLVVDAPCAKTTAECVDLPTTGTTEVPGESSTTTSTEVPDGCVLSDGSVIPEGPYKDPTDPCNIGDCNKDRSGIFTMSPIITDCAEMMGVPCAGKYEKVPGQCCSVCKDSTTTPSIEVPDGCVLSDGSVIPEGPYKDPTDPCNVGDCNKDRSGIFTMSFISFDCAEMMGVPCAGKYEKVPGQCCSVCKVDYCTGNDQCPLGTMCYDPVKPYPANSCAPSICKCMDKAPSVGWRVDLSIPMSFTADLDAKQKDSVTNAFCKSFATNIGNSIVKCKMTDKLNSSRRLLASDYEFKASVFAINIGHLARLKQSVLKQSIYSDFVASSAAVAAGAIPDKGFTISSANVFVQDSEETRPTKTTTDAGADADADSDKQTDADKKKDKDFEAPEYKILFAADMTFDDTPTALQQKKIKNEICQLVAKRTKLGVGRLTCTLTAKSTSSRRLFADESIFTFKAETVLDKTEITAVIEEQQLKGIAGVKFMLAEVAYVDIPSLPAVMAANGGSALAEEDVQLVEYDALAAEPDEGDIDDEDASNGANTAAVSVVALTASSLLCLA